MINKLSKRQGLSGFTLVELAMVLFILSLLLGGILGPLSTQLEGAERKQTSALLEEIKGSLIGYTMVNGHLPCPDCSASSTGCTTPNDGEEDGVDSSANPTTRGNYQGCAVEEGNLPWVTLGVPEFDAWGNHFAYRVTETFADDVDGTSSGACTVTAGMSFQICSTGNISVKEDPSSSSTVATDIVALVLSYGKNADDDGNPSSNFENENQDSSNAIFIDRDYSKDTTNQFDDMLIWIPNNSLIYRMVQAERLP